MFKFLFALFIIGCVFMGGSRLIAHYWHGSSEVAFNTPLGPINWLLIGTCALCFGAYKMIK